jgi:hypothetical protein
MTAQRKNDPYEGCLPKELYREEGTRRRGLGQVPGTVVLCECDATCTLHIPKRVPSLESVNRWPCLHGSREPE